MSDHLRLIKPKPHFIRAHNLVMNQTATDILRSVQLVAEEPGTLTMIAGIPGCGKTAPLDSYAVGNPGTIKLDVVASERSVWDQSTAIMEYLELGAPNSRRKREDRQTIMDAIGYGRVVIFDEAQYMVAYNPRGGLNFDLFEWVRSMAEEEYFSVVFCGDLSLAETISAVPQLRRRMVRPVVIRSIPRGDVAEFAAAYGVTDSAVVDALTATAKRHGGLADVKRAIQHARKRATSAEIVAADVKAALVYLGLSANGGLS